ncbi:MAG TPA: PAS domain S-box protein [Candidatus Binatia bacterium]|jgi:PAS domain S-box-containing protein
MTRKVPDARAAKDAAGCYQTVFEQAAVGIARVDAGGEFLEVNDRFCEIVGYAREHLMRGGFQQITHPDDLAADLANVARLLADEASSFVMEKRYVRSDGEIVWVTLHVGLVRDAEGRPASFVSVVNDITDAKRAEQMLTDYSARLESLSRRLLSVQEEERRALARELHDQVGQQLAALKLNLERLRTSHPELANDARLADSIEITDRTINQIGDTSLDLRPSVLDDLGLLPALHWYARRQQARSGCEIAIHGSVEERLPGHIETAAFRIVQEAVNNAIRHGQADRVSVEIVADAASVTVAITDHGRGFDPEAAATFDSGRSCLGLLSMRERAELLGGEFQLRAAVGEGVAILARLPL